MNLALLIKPAGKLVGDLIRFHKGGFSPDEGRQLAADGLALAAPLLQLVPAPVGPLASGIVGALAKATAEGHDLPTIGVALVDIVTGHVSDAATA